MNPTPELTKVIVGKQIANAMKIRKAKPTHLAAYMDISESTLRRFIDGTTEPSYRQIVRAAEYLGKPLDWFTTETPPEEEAA